MPNSNTISPSYKDTKFSSSFSWAIDNFVVILYNLPYSSEGWT